MNAFVRLSFAAAIALSPLAAVQAQSYDSSAFSESVADELDPGAFRWASDTSGVGPVTMQVSIARQLAYVYRGDRLIGVSTVSTGKTGHDTPTGVFPILQKKLMNYSNLYDNAPMPFMQRLTWDGVALHSGKIPGYAASHGCVRLPNAFAKQLYGMTSIGSTVTIVDDFDQAPITVATSVPAYSPAPTGVTQVSYQTAAR